MVSQQKIEEVKDLAEKISQAKTIGLVDIKGVPSKQFQKMRISLKGKAEIKVGKNTLIKRAFEKANLKKLEDKVEGSIGLISSKLDPFQLNKILKENKSSAPAKPGDKAPYDIIIPAGDTSLAAGPILGELQKVGIKAQIKEGKIFVREDSLVAKKGELISEELAPILSRFGIEPKEISLDMKVAYDDSGLLYSPEILEINQEEVLKQINAAAKKAFNLAFNAGIFTSFTLPLFIQVAAKKAFNLAFNAEILNKETLPYLLQKAHSQALALSSLLPEKPKEGENNS